MTSKEALRAEILRRRADRDERQREAAGTAIADLLPRIDVVKRASCVALYLSTDTEPPTWTLADLLRERAVRVLTPLVRPGRRLDWAEYAGRGELRTAAYGISEPATPPLGPEAVGAADVVVLPALAIDRHGHRLGRGAGYYDRALAYTNPVAARIAVVYADELITHVPTEAHDEAVHFAVTPERIWACSAP
ncbi:MAG TPA: 5-formyltetrahydrofolate cyclo-ligase [Brevibacterium sp.]|nr:5-formyltetrahydrofolate cyclo-ligase [Brevibacterium sp.]